MIKNKLYPFLEKYINEFLWGFSKEQLKVGVVNGTIVLEKLNIRIDQVNKKLDLNDTPLWMKSGSIQKIQVSCSLMNFIGEKPLEITIDNIDIILCPSAKWILRNLNSFIKENDFHLKESYDPIDNNFQDIFLRSVNIYDGSILKNKSKIIEFFKDKSKIAEILNKIFNLGLKYYYQKSYLINLKIKNFHLRFEDDLHNHMFLKPGLSEKIGDLKEKKNKIAMGLTIQDLELNFSADGNVKKNNFKVENLNAYFGTNPEIYIPIKTFFEHLDKDLVINEKYYEFLKNNLVDFNKIINNFNVAPNNNQNNSQLRLQKNLYFQCLKILDNLNFIGNFGINSTDKGNIDFFSKTREKNYKFFIQIATNDIKIELNDFIINYVKNILKTMRSVYIIDTNQEFKPMRKPYKVNESSIQKILSDEKSSENFNRKRKMVVRDWLHYMVWFSRFKKAIYGKLNNNLLQDEFSRYYNICCNNSGEMGNVLDHLENIKHQSSNDAVIDNNNKDNLSPENNEINLKKELNQEEINLNFSSDFLLKSITLKILNAFEKDQDIDLNNFHKHIKNENGVILRINSIDKKAFLTKEDFSLSFSLKSFILETEKNKISIFKNLEEKINSKDKEMKSISGSAARVPKQQEFKFNEIPKSVMASSNSKSSLNSGNNAVPNLKITMRPSNPNNNYNENLDYLGYAFNNNNINQTNFLNRSDVNSVTYENNDNFRHKKKLSAIDEVLDNIGGMNSSHINNSYRHDESFLEIKSKNNVLNSLFNKDKNQLETKRIGNIVDILLEKERDGNAKQINNKDKNYDKISVIPSSNVYSDIRKGIKNDLYVNPNGLTNLINKPAYQNILDIKGITNQSPKSSNGIKLVFNNQGVFSNGSHQIKSNPISANNMNINAISNNKEILFSPESQLNQNPSNNKLRIRSNASISNNNYLISNENVNLVQENIAYIDSNNAFNIKTHNFQDIFKCSENNINNNSNNLKSEISKLNFFEISKIKSDEKTKANLCLDFSYHKKNHIEKLEKNKKISEEISVINDKFYLLTGDLCFNITNNTVREAKEILEKLINVKNLNFQRIKNSNLVKNIGLEKDLFELRLNMLAKLENDINLINCNEEPKHKNNSLKLDNFKKAYSKMNKKETINYIQYLKNEINKIDKSILNDKKMDYRIYKIFEFLKKKSFEIEVNIPIISVFSYVNSNNQNSVSSNTNKNQIIHNLMSRTKIPRIYLYLFIQNDSLLLKFLEYEYEFYSNNNCLKIEFSEFLEIIKIKYDLLKFPIEVQLDALIKEDDLNKKEKNNSNKKNQDLLDKAGEKNREILSKTIASANTPNKFGVSNKQDFLIDKNIKNSNSDFNNLNKKPVNEGNTKNNSSNFLEESVTNYLNTTKKIKKSYPKIDENLNNSSDINSMESAGLGNINNNINSINRIISKNISNNNYINAKNPQSSLFINKDEIKDFSHNNNDKFGNINESLDNTIKISVKDNLYLNDLDNKKVNFYLKKDSPEKNNFENLSKNYLNKSIKKKNTFETKDNNYDFFNSIKDLDENVIPNEASKDIYVNNIIKHNLNNESSRIFPPLSKDKIQNIKVIDQGSLNKQAQDIISNNSNDKNLKSFDPYISKKSSINENLNSKVNPYTDLNKQSESLKSNNLNLQKSSNATDKITEIMRNKTSSNNTSNYDKSSLVNAFGDKILANESNKNSSNVEIKDNSNNRSSVRSSIANKKKEDINDILKQYKMSAKPASQNKIASLKSRTKSIK